MLEIRGDMPDTVLYSAFPAEPSVQLQLHGRDIGYGDIRVLLVERQEHRLGDCAGPYLENWRVSPQPAHAPGISVHAPDVFAKPVLGIALLHQIGQLALAPVVPVVDLR